MLKPMKRSVAAVLVWLQIMMLLTVAAPQTLAVEDTAQPAQAAPAAAVMDAETEQQTPVLNPVIEGTVRFGSFNYTGDNGGTKDNTNDDRDGVDYVSTFYYSDDYFSASAVNPNATAKVMDWTALEDRGMATLSKDFTIACYGSSENTFPTDWDHKDKNGLKFLEDCEFDYYASNSEFNMQTGADTVGAIYGSKVITVYDQTTGKNDTFTLIAVGVRGAGYGAEWASNLTIGNPDNATLANSGKYRHYGFDSSADKVMAGLDEFLRDHPITTQKAKYWVVGYSRAGAIANLVAGTLSDDNYSHYKTSKEHVYGYTYEAAAGALKTEDEFGTKYPNIHNILNKMDAVPLVSPALFNHIRLGVDYYLPYYKFTGTNDANPNIETYYNNMYNTLKKVAVIADLYNGNVNQNRDSDGNLIDHTEDPTLTDANPNTYPYKSPVQIYSFGITNYSSGFVETVSNSSSSIAKNYSGFKGRGNGMMMDEFLNAFVPKFLESRSWDVKLIKSQYGGYNSDSMTYDWKSHEYQYVHYYQEALRTLAADALKNPGMGLSSLSGLKDKALSAVDFRALLQVGSLAYHYGLLNLGSRYNYHVMSMIDPMTNLVNKVIEALDMFNEEDLDEVENSIATIMPVLTWLYCEDHSKNNAEYVGTVFANVGTILVTHIPELGVSWLMSLDDVFISDYREITLPKNANISMYLFRPGIDDAYAKQIDAEGVNAAGEATGALVATVNGGVLADSKDARISVSESGENVIIRYPGNLDIRFDVTATSDDVNVQLADYAPANVVNVYSTAERATQQSEAYNVSNITDTHVVRDGIGENSVMTPDTTQSAQDINTLSNGTEIPLKAGDTLQIMAWHGSNQVVGAYDATYAISKTSTKVQVVDFTAPVTLSENAMGVKTESSHFANNSGTVTYQLPQATMTAGGTYTAYAAVEEATSYGQSQAAYGSTGSRLYWSDDITVIPSSSIYYDDDLRDSVDSNGHGYSASLQATPAENDTAAGTYTINFTGTGIDIYCTTHDSAGYIQAKLDGDNAMLKTMRSQSDTTRYNVPTISYTGLTYGPHTVTLKVLSNAHYQFDGFRVYNSVSDQSVYEGTGEQYATYINLRKALVNDAQDYQFKDDTGTVEITDQNAKNGALFVESTEGMVDMSAFDAYKTNSPKNEIYLAAGQSITFQLTGFDPSAGQRLWIGMSAPDEGVDFEDTENPVQFTINNEDKAVTSAVDMYYEITDMVGTSGSITITNTSTTAMLAVTNLKITGNQTVYETAEAAAAGSANVTALNEAVFAPVTEETVKLAAMGGFDPDAPKANWNETANETATLLSELFRLLLQSLEALFANVQTW